MNVIIIEDDPRSIENLELRLKKCDFDIDIIGVAQTVNEAVELLNTTNPDLVFMDIDIVGGTGFDVLNATDGNNHNIIFTTCHNDKAIEAIKHHALGYILKPFSLKTLNETISRVYKKILSSKHLWKLNNQKDGKIVIKISGEYHFFDQSDILRIEGDGSYSYVYTTNKKLTACKCLKEFERELNNNIFLRIHRSHIVNINHITTFQKGDSCQLTVSDNVKINVSRSYKKNGNQIVGFLTFYLIKVIF